MDPNASLGSSSNIIKESWKYYSKTQKFQLLGILALVLIIPAIISGVATAKYLGSRASVPVTPPVTPSSTPSSALPDLIISGPISVSSSPEMSTRVLITFKLANIGNSLASPAQYSYTDQADGFSQIDPSNTCTGSTSLKPQASCISAYQFTFKTHGTKILKIKLDPQNLVKESNEANNDYSVTAIAGSSPTPTPILACGRVCQTSAQCSTGLICYQPPMPTCPPDAVNCVQAIPICRNPSCPTKTNCLCPTPTPRPTVRPTPTPRPMPMPTSFPKATSCSSVSVSGATYGGIVNGKILYYLSSGGSATLTANTVPVKGLVNWKIASFSFRLANGGRFSTNNNPTVVYTAPVNTSGSDQGVEIRGDISEYPNPPLFCPVITMAIHSN